MTTSAHHTRVQAGGLTIEPTDVQLDLNENQIPYATAIINCALTSSPVEILSNDFETGSITFWFKGNVTAEISTEQAHSPTHSVKLTPDGDGMVTFGETIPDVPPTQEGHVYQASVWVYSPTGYPLVRASLIGWDPTDHQYYFGHGQPQEIPAGEWVRLEALSAGVTASLNKNTILAWRVYMLGEPTTGDVLYLDDGAVHDVTTLPNVLDPRQRVPVHVSMRQVFGTSRTLADISADYAGMTLEDMEVDRARGIINPDPSFESGVSLWSASPSDAASTVLAHSDVQAHTGAYSLEVTGTGTGVISAVWMTDMLPIDTLIRWYRRAWVYPTTTITLASIRIYYYDADGVQYDFAGQARANPAIGQWTELGSGFTDVPSPAEAVNYRFFRLEVQLTGTNPHAYIDDVSLRYGRGTLASFTAEYGDAFNAGGWRPSTRVRAALWLRNRVVDHEAGTISIEGASPDAALQDYALTSRVALTPGGSTVRDCVNLVLGHVLNTALPAGSTGAEIVETDALAWQPGESGWSYLSSIIGTAGLRLWANEVGRWHLEDPEVYPPVRQWNATVENAATMSDTISRDAGDWADSAVVTYEWTDGSGNQQTRYDAAGDTGGRTVTRTVERAYPGAGLAAGMLRRAQALGRTVDLGGVADYSLRPYHAASVDLPETALQAGAISGVTWRQPDDVMTVRTRGLLGITENSYLYTPPGVSYNDVPAGVSYDEYVWTG